MTSSTSSSEEAPSWLALLVRWTLPGALVASTLFALAAIWARMWPVPDSNVGLTETLILHQRHRAEHAPRADIVILGDSCAFQNFDAQRMSEALGVEVQGFGTVAAAGPAGFLKLMQLYIPRFETPPTVVLIVNELSLGIDPQGDGFVRSQALIMDPIGDRSVFESVRVKFFTDVLSRVVDFPAQGLWGPFYGSRSDLRDAIDVWHGTVANPNPPLEVDPTKPPIAFLLTPELARRFAILRDGLRALGVRRLFIDIAPIPRAYVGPQSLAGRTVTIDQWRQVMGLPPEAILGLPAVLPTGLFSDEWHMSRVGRERSTDLAIELFRNKVVPPDAREERGAPGTDD